jgi:hypothetical protein
VTLRQRDEPRGIPVRFAVAIPHGTAYRPSEVSRGISISPDGTRLVIEVVAKGRRRLHVRPLDAEESVELEGSLDASSHFWSPDSRFLAFYVGGKLKKIPATGGQAEEICDAPLAFVGTWNQEGTILFSRLDPPGIYSVSALGGEPVRILAPDSDQHGVNYSWPDFLPDGRRFLYIHNVAPGEGNDELRVASLDSKESRSVARMESRVEYVAPGFLLYVREDTLFAQQFDERMARLGGEPRQLVSGVHYFRGPSHAPFSVSRTGVLAYQMAPATSRLAWFNREGKEIGQIGDAAVV